MSAHLDLDDVASGNPLAEEELKNLRDNADWSSDKIIQLAKENADMRAELEKLEAKLEGWIQKYIELEVRHSNRRAALDEMREALDEALDYVNGQNKELYLKMCAVLAKYPGGEK